MYSATLPVTADVVRMAEGDASRSTELTRSSLAPPSGTDSGTAISRPVMRRETQDVVKSLRRQYHRAVTG